jgi:hypothetical protein
MKFILVALLSLAVSSSWADTSPRALALEQFPAQVRDLVGKKILEARTVLKDVPSNKRREDERGLFVNLLGINYDITLGKKAETVEWLALRSPPQHAKGLYEKIMEKYAKTAKIKDVQVGGPAPGQYIEVSFPRDGVQFRFMSSNKDLYSVVVQRKP